MMVCWFQGKWGLLIFLKVLILEVEFGDVPYTKVIANSEKFMISTRNLKQKLNITGKI